MRTLTKKTAGTYYYSSRYVLYYLQYDYLETILHQDRYYYSSRIPYTLWYAGYYSTELLTNAYYHSIW